MFYVYLLESTKYKQVYIGSTNDLRRRLREHNDDVEISTRRYKPWRLVSYEACQSEQDAREREKRLKSHGNANKEFKKRARNSFKNDGGLPSTIFKDKNGAGFTLIETLIYLAIVAVAVGSFVVFSISVSGSRNKTFVIQEVQANARTAIQIMSQKIRAAEGINTAASTFGVDPGVLSLAVSDISKDPTVFELDQDDGILRITEGTASPVVLVSDEVKITNLVFTNLTSGGKGNIRIELTVEYNNDAGDIGFSHSQSIQTSVGLR